MTTVAGGVVVVVVVDNCVQVCKITSVTRSNAVRVNGAAIREIRKSRGLDQTTFAKRVGKDRAFIAHIEAGRRSPSPETFNAIVAVLKIEDQTAIMADPVAS